jgi:hypothetical protein
VQKAGQGRLKRRGIESLPEDPPKSSDYLTPFVTLIVFPFVAWTFVLGFRPDYRAQVAALLGMSDSVASIKRSRNSSSNNSSSNNIEKELQGDNE